MAHSIEMTPDITVLMPNIPDTAWERTDIRYTGLFRELEGRHGLSTAMVVGMNTYSEQDEAFIGGYSIDTKYGSFDPVDSIIHPRVVRDLTMAVGKRPLYESGATVVHDPAFNEIIADKAQVYDLLPDLHPITFGVTNESELHDALDKLPGDTVVIKPATGSVSEGLIIDRKEQAAALVAALGFSKKRIAQAFVETEQGIPELQIEGRHNVRVIMIGGRAIYGFGRLAAAGSLFIVDDSFDNLRFYMPDDFPDDLHEGVERVQDVLATLPGGLNTVIAADFMRGHQAGEESKMELCELNRRPYRNSPYDSVSDGNLWASRQWDIHEAQLLSKVVENRL